MYKKKTSPVELLNEMQFSVSLENAVAIQEQQVMQRKKNHEKAQMEWQLCYQKVNLYEKLKKKHLLQLMQGVCLHIDTYKKEM